jgi:hypothetical protein
VHDAVLTIKTTTDHFLSLKVLFVSIMHCGSIGVLDFALNIESNEIAVSL